MCEVPTLRYLIKVRKLTFHNSQLFLFTSPLSSIILAVMDLDTSAMTSRLRFPPEILSNITENFRCRKSPDELSYLWTTVGYFPN